MYTATTPCSVVYEDYACSIVYGDYALFCCIWGLRPALLYTATTPCSVVYGDYALFCCIWRLRPVLLYMATTPCSVVYGDCALFCCIWRLRSVLLYMVTTFSNTPYTPPIYSEWKAILGGSVNIWWISIGWIEFTQILLSLWSHDCVGPYSYREALVCSYTDHWVWDPPSHNEPES